MTDIELSIILPCLNEAETLEICIQKAQRFLRQHNVVGEVVVGDNGSTDGSLEIAAAQGARIVPVPIRGYGAAIFYAMKSAKGKYFIMADSDDSYDLEGLEKFLTKLREGKDFVMGNRFLGEIFPGAMPWKNRYIGNPALSSIGRLLFRTPIGDFHCGIRGLSRKAFHRLQLRSVGMEFASEMVIKASLFKLSIAEVPTTLKPDGRSRPPHLRPWRDGWRHLRLMFLFSPRWLFLYPGMIVMALGAFLGLAVYQKPWTLGSFHLDINSLIYSGAMVLIGFQSVAFAFFTKIFATQVGLLPPDLRLNRLFKFVSLETGLVIGSLLLIFGFYGFYNGFSIWQQAGFINLDSRQMVRITFPSALSLILGFQIILSSFFFSVLGLRIDYAR